MKFMKPFVSKKRLLPWLRLLQKILSLLVAFQKPAMTGWRIGYMIAPDYINEVAKLINEGVTYSAPTLSQQAESMRYNILTNL